MHTELKKHPTPAQPSPTGPTTATQTTVASDDNDHIGKLISEEDLRLCAYLKWEAAGKPSGDGVQFWLEAEQELVDGKNETFVQRGGRHGHRQHKRLEAERAVNDCYGRVDSHYRDNNRMFQGHGERGHRHGGSR